MVNRYDPRVMSARKFVTELPPIQATLYLQLYQGQPKSVDELFGAITQYMRRSTKCRRTTDTRRKQMRLGASITELNRKLADRGRVIRPGEERNTYKMYHLSLFG